MNTSTPPTDGGDQPDGGDPQPDGASAQPNGASAQPNGASAQPDGGPASGGRSSDRFFAWFRELGIIRGSDRWFAGVAGGIAAKAGIDPLIVRGVFVVLALLGGSGILLYLIAWLLLPDFTGRIHLEEVIRGRASAGVIVTVVILGALVVIPLVFRVLPSVFMPWQWDVWNTIPGLDWVSTTMTVIWYALILPGLIIWFIVWLVRRGPRPPGSGPAPHATAPHGTVPHATASEGSSSGSTSAAWDRVDAATDRFADQTAAMGERIGEWGERAGEWGDRVGRETSDRVRTEIDRHQALRLGSAHVVLTLALALLAAGGAAAWALSRSASSDLVLTAGLLGAVGVLACSLIVAGIRGRHSGWIGFLSFLGVLALIFAPFTSLLPDHTRFVPFGDTTLVAENDEPDSALVLLAGNADVDLSELREDAAPRDIQVWLFGGNSTIELPDEAAVRVDTHVIAGNILSGDGDSDLRDGEPDENGIFLNHRIGANLSGSSGTDVITVRVNVAFGQVRILDADDRTAENSAALPRASALIRTLGEQFAQTREVTP